MNRSEPSDCAVLQPVLYDLKPPQRAPVVGDPQRDTTRLKRADHTQALGVIECHWLLDETGLASRSDPKGEIAMARRRCRDVDSVDVGVVNQIVGAIVGAGDIMTACIIARLLAVAPHDGDER